MATLVNGSVKWFDNSKGFGFIEQEGGEDIFVHFSQINCEEGAFRTLNEGQKVTFEIGQNDKGQQAENVTGL